MIVKTATEMQDFGARLLLERPDARVIELVGDVGAGKTTLVQGLARALGVEKTVTSPSFTISKVYETLVGRLIHYDFYRLEDAGVMREELAEALADESAIVVVEWADAVRGVLPDERLTVRIRYLADGSREVLADSAEVDSREARR